MRDQIRLILNKLAERKFVHGDMRSANVLFDTLRNRVVLVDFDWAGRDGIDHYPPFMNPEIEWHGGATTGAFLRCEHDHHWWREWFSEEKMMDQ